jgi:hypothetical protein
VILSTILSRSNKISAHVYDQKDTLIYANNQIAKAKEKFTKTKDAKGKITVEVLPESTWFGAQAAATPPALIKGIFPQTGVAAANPAPENPSTPSMSLPG